MYMLHVRMHATYEWVRDTCEWVCDTCEWVWHVRMSVCVKGIVRSYEWSTSNDYYIRIQIHDSWCIVWYIHTTWLVSRWMNVWYVVGIVGAYAYIRGTSHLFTSHVCVYICTYTYVHIYVLMCTHGNSAMTSLCCWQSFCSCHICILYAL